MTATICWLCKTNLTFLGCEEEKYLDEDGNKPCLECLTEMQEEEENEL